MRTFQWVSGRFKVAENRLSCRGAMRGPEPVHGSVIAALLLMLAAPALAWASSPLPQAPETPPETLSSTHSFAITEEMIGSRFPPMSLKKRADSAEYGYSDKRPIAVGGGLDEGSHNVYRYLNAVAGPKGEKVHYTRIGTCCAFDAADSPFGRGLLEVYEISSSGLPRPARLYFNWYGPPDPLIPVGLVVAEH